MFGRWLLEWKAKRQLNERERIYTFRKSLKLKRQILISLYLLAHNSRRLLRIKKKVTERTKARLISSMLFKWRNRYAEQKLEERLLKH